MIRTVQFAVATGLGFAPVADDKQSSVFLLCSTPRNYWHSTSSPISNNPSINGCMSLTTSPTRQLWLAVGITRKPTIISKM